MKQLILTKSNIQALITWGNGESCTLHPCGTLHTFCLDISAERTTSHKCNFPLLRNKHSQHGLCWRSSCGAQQHPGLRSASALHQAQPDTDASRPRLVLATPALLWPCTISNHWQSVTVPPSHAVCHQQGGAAEACPMLSPLCPFLLTGDWGHPVFQDTADSYKKAGVNSRSFARTWIPQGQVHISPTNVDLLQQKSNPAWPGLTRRVTASQARSCAGKTSAKRPHLPSNTSSTDLQAQTTSERMLHSYGPRTHLPHHAQATERRLFPQLSHVRRGAGRGSEGHGNPSTIRLVRRSPDKPCHRSDHCQVSCLPLAGLSLHPSLPKSRMAKWEASGSLKKKKKSTNQQEGGVSHQINNFYKHPKPNSLRDL